MKTKEQRLQELTEEYSRKSNDANWTLSAEGHKVAMMISELSKPTANK